MKAVIFNGAKEGDMTIKAIEENIAEAKMYDRPYELNRAGCAAQETADV